MWYNKSITLILSEVKYNVVVVADQMTTNEKYIAYTRALEELVVVNDKFIKNVEEEYVEEDILDDDIIEIK